MMRPTPLLLLPLFLTTGCVKFVRLKKTEVFTDKKVKTMQFDDACRLQSYFDGKPPPLLVLDERTAGLATANLEQGETTLEVAKGPQLNKLGEILKRFYAKVPPPLLKSRLRITTVFVRRVSTKKTRNQQGRRIAQRVIGATLLPKDAEITVHAGKDRVVLAYHPCVGEFLFGRLTYKLRRQLLSPAPTPRRRAPSKRRAQPRPAPPRVKARPAPPRRKARPAPPRREARQVPRARPERRPPMAPSPRTSPLPELPR